MGDRYDKISRQGGRSQKNMKSMMGQKFRAKPDLMDLDFGGAITGEKVQMQLKPSLAGNRREDRLSTEHKLEESSGKARLLKTSHLARRKP